MKFPIYPALGLLLLSGSVASAETAKTAYPVKIKPGQVDMAPYRYNGAILTDQFRGSGFCAWNSLTFFSAAHVVYDLGWMAPPIWYPAANTSVLDESTAVQSRGYYRWTEYAGLVADTSASSGFSQDVILGYAFKKLIRGGPATLNLNGVKDLKKKREIDDHRLSGG